MTEKQMTAALTIAGTETRNNIKVTLKSLRNGALNSLAGFTEDYISNGCLGQQIVNMPARFLAAFEMIT